MQAYISISGSLTELERDAGVASLLSGPRRESADCVETLVRGMLYKVCRLEKHAALDAEIGEMAASLRENGDNLSAYHRVSIVQRFIHQRVDIAMGYGAHTSLPVHHMRNALSACRLHLLITDVRSKHEAYAVYMDELSQIATHLERDRIESRRDTMADRASPHWRIRHLKTLTHFIEPGSRQRITRLREIDDDLPLEEFRREALDIYAS